MTDNFDSYVEENRIEPLPPGWEARSTTDSRVVYYNEIEKSTQMTHPVNGRRKTLKGNLPRGWKIEQYPGHLVFVHEADRIVTMKDPRLQIADSDVQKTTIYSSRTTANDILEDLDLSDKVVMITGANSGIGFETARSLAIHGAHVFLACRSVEKARIAQQKIISEKENAKVDILQCDLSSLVSIKTCVKHFLALELPLNILILNAASCGKAYTKTDDSDLEWTFTVNHLGHFYLTHLLTEKLIRSMPSRVVAVTAEQHRRAVMLGCFDSEINKPAELLSMDVLSPPAEKYNWLKSYYLSKLCNLWFVFLLNAKFAKYGVTCNAANPGSMISTNLNRESCFMRTLHTLMRPFSKSPEQGAATVVLAAIAPEYVAGKYFNNAAIDKPHECSRNYEYQEMLWTFSQNIVDRFEQNNHVE